MNPSYEISDKPVPPEQWIVRPGEVYNSLTIIGEPFWAKNPGWKRNYKGLISNRQYVRARCVCGIEREFSCPHVKCGGTKSCGKSCKGSPEAREKNLKKCTKCKRYLDQKAFGSNKSKKDGLATECFQCHTVAKLREYGLTLDAYNVLLEKQGAVCAICCQSNVTVKNEQWQPLHVDHDHVSGKVRGLLCHKCNVALGLFNEDAALLRKAIFYLERDSDE